MPGIILGARDTAVNKIDKKFPTVVIHILWEKSSKKQGKWKKNIC